MRFRLMAELGAQACRRLAGYDIPAIPVIHRGNWLSCEQVPLVLADDAELDSAYEADFEHWMRTVGAAAYEHAKAHPELAMTAEEARARLAAARAKRRQLGDE